MPCAALVVVLAEIDKARLSGPLCAACNKCPVLYGSAWRHSLTIKGTLHTGRVHGRHCVRRLAWRGPIAELGMALSRTYAASAEYCREAAAQLVAGRWTAPIAIGSLALLGIWRIVAFIRRAAVPAVWLAHLGVDLGTNSTSCDTLRLLGALLPAALPITCKAVLRPLLSKRMAPSIPKSSTLGGGDAALANGLGQTQTWNCSPRGACPGMRSRARPCG